MLSHPRESVSFAVDGRELERDYGRPLQLADRRLTYLGGAIHAPQGRGAHRGPRGTFPLGLSG